MKITKDQAIEILLKEHIRRILKEGEAGTPEEPKEEPEAEPEVEPEVEPEAEPEVEPEEEGMSEEIADLTDMYIRKLRTSFSADSDDIVDIIGRIFDAFKYGNQAKLEILKKIKEENIR